MNRKSLSRCSRSRSAWVGGLYSKPRCLTRHSSSVASVIGPKSLRLLIDCTAARPFFGGACSLNRLPAVTCVPVNSLGRQPISGDRRPIHMGCQRLAEAASWSRPRSFGGSANCAAGPLSSTPSLLTATAPSVAETQIPSSCPTIMPPSSHLDVTASSATTSAAAKAGSSHRSIGAA